MAYATKGKLNFRCPSCFMRDLDLDMFYDAEKGEYYCLRCAFRGDEKTVRFYNEQAKYRYGRMKERVVDFGEDNQPPKFVPHQRGTR